MEENKNLKRNGYISWDEYFMGIAMLSAERSKDPNTQVGSCIVNDENKIVSNGEKYKFKFKIVEIYERIVSFFLWCTDYSPVQMI